ncbi:MAG: hypothetical protein V1708_01295 [Candidatus Micrarchaeota archaeon]
MRDKYVANPKLRAIMQQANATAFSQKTGMPLVRAQAALECLPLLVNSEGMVMPLGQFPTPSEFAFGLYVKTSNWARRLICPLFYWKSGTTVPDLARKLIRPF